MGYDLVNKAFKWVNEIAKREKNCGRAARLRDNKMKEKN